jgi:hypothetical protein
MDSSIKFLTTVYISFFVEQHDVTHHPAYQPELLSSRTVSMSVTLCDPLGLSMIKRKSIQLQATPKDLHLRANSNDMFVIITVNCTYLYLTPPVMVYDDLPGLYSRNQ